MSSQVIFVKGISASSRPAPRRPVRARKTRGSRQSL